MKILKTILPDPLLDLSNSFSSAFNYFSSSSDIFLCYNVLALDPFVPPEHPYQTFLLSFCPIELNFTDNIILFD